MYDAVENNSAVLYEDSTPGATSIEVLLVVLETALERGEITMAEASQVINDFCA